MFSESVLETCAQKRWLQLPFTLGSTIGHGSPVQQHTWMGISIATITENQCIAIPHNGHYTLKSEQVKRQH